MPDSITVRLPPLRRVIAILAWVVGVAVLLGIGIAVGSRLFRADPITTLVTPGAVQQVRVSSGAVYVGRIAGSGDDVLQLAEPAVVRQADAGPSAGSSAAPRLVVEALTVEPYDSGGALMIPITSVEWVGTIRPGSGLEAAYRQALAAAAGAPAASAAP